jgi:translation elongation factor EF-4
VAYVKVVEGEFSPKKEVQLIHSQTSISPPELGYFDPSYVRDTTLKQ